MRDRGRDDRETFRRVRHEEPPAGLPPLPARAWNPWPGTPIPWGEGSVFVRRTPVRGDGPHEPAVLVHGLGGSSTNWTDLAGLVAGRLDCWALDLPGFGRSAPPVSGSYPLDGHAQAVIELIEARQAGPVHLAGNSLGGAVSLRVAADRPDLVRTLTLVSPALPDLRVRRVEPLLPLTLLPGVGRFATARLAASSPQARVRRTIELCWADPTRVAPLRVQEAVAEAERRASLPWAEDAFTGSLRGLLRAGLARGSRAPWRQLAALRLPTLVVWGRKDRLVDVRLAARCLRLLPDGRLLLLDDVGHVAQMEAAYDVAEQLLTLVGVGRAPARSQS